MPELSASALSIDDRFACDLVIDTFDQMNNTTDMSLLLTHFCGCGAPSADAGDRAV